MFTGIIEEIGTIKKLSRAGSKLSVEISAREVLKGTRTGDSIAVNGACLTATSVSRSSFKADVMGETVSHTTFDAIRAGDRVNLERPLKISDRLSGHLVSGHIDCTGTIKSVNEGSGQTRFTVEVPEEVKRYIVYKGSVTVDGISLTVAGVGNRNFVVSVIPHTLKSTTLGSKKAGDKVNIEADMIGKYIERYVDNIGSPEQKKNNAAFKDYFEWAGGISVCN